MPPGIQPHPRRRRPRPLRRACVWALLGVLALAGAARADTSKEYQIKAAFLYNFTKFVEWPPESMPAPGAPVIIGVLGSDPFDGALQKIVEGRKHDGRPFATRVVKSPADLRGVQVLFVPAREEARLEAAAPERLAGVLVVLETDALFERRGVIKFHTTADRVRFDINADAAERAGLRISAQLLKLATAVRRKNGGA